MIETSVNQSGTAPQEVVSQRGAGPSRDDGRPDRRECPLFRSFTGRVAASAIVMITVSALLIMFSLDYFLNRDFEIIQTAQVRGQMQRVDAYVKRQVSDLSAYAHAALRNDDLRKNVVAHLNHQESTRWLQSFVTSTTSLYKLDSMTLWNADGGLIVATETIIGNMALQLSNYPIHSPRYPQAGLVELSGQLWAVSTAPIIVDRKIIAVVQFSRLLNDRITQDHLLDASISIATPQGRNQGTTVAGTLDIKTVDGRPLVISIARSDSTELAGLKLTSKAYVTGVIAMVCVILASIFLLLIRRETLPFRVLQKSFAAVGHGDFDRKITIRGCSEAIALCDGFNNMLADLSRLREAETSVQQEIKLAAIGRLGARVAHDINNPLSVIRAISDLSRRQMRDKDPMRASDMNRIYEQSNRCLQIAENLVAFSKPRNIDLEPLDLYEQCVLYLQERKRQYPQFQYELINSDNNCTINGNRYYLWQILDNLTDNAIEANDGGAVQFRCYADEQWGVIEISDNGPGFAVDSEQDIFELFFTTKPRGTGLGLPNALSIARAFGGMVRVTNPACGQISIFMARVKTVVPHPADKVVLVAPYAIALTPRAETQDVT